MMQMQGGFNANQHEPNQGFGIHPPVQKIPFSISNTEIKETSAKDGGYFVVEFTTPQGIIRQNYNIWNKNPKAVEIAHGQLSALCRAVNIYSIEWTNEGAALRGGKGVMDIGYQKGEEPSPSNPDAKGYTEVKRVYDMAGNDPARVKQNGSSASPQGQGQAPEQASWGGSGQAVQTNQQAPNPNWNGPQAQGQAPTPPWGNR
jgi:hypothetical protein